MRAAAIQMTSGRDVERNLAEADRLLAVAADGGAELAVLPENFAFLGASDGERQAIAEAPGQGPAQEFLAAAAARYRLWLVGGTIPVRADAQRSYSRSLLFGPDGVCAAQYDKIHLFDVDIPGKAKESYRESATTLHGATPVVYPSPLGRIGMSVCYDLRFPALFHRLGVLGMDILVLPAAFTVPTGRAHWLTLLRARAIESLVYVVASGQWGEHAGGRQTYGHSVIIGPWGEPIECLQSGVGVVSAELDMIELQQIREQFPALKHRREL